MTPFVSPGEGVKLATERRIYDRAPILETILEIRVAPAGTDLAALVAAHVGEEGRYPQATRIMEGSVNVEMTGVGASASTATQQVGHQWANPGGAELFRATVNLFSYHKLRPYTRWEACRDEARRLWAKYLSTVGPDQVTRIGLRYVNRLDLPDSVELADYLLTQPQIAPGIHQGLSSYLMVLTIPQPDMPGTRVVLRQGSVAPPSPNIASVVLDIDLIQDLEVAADNEAVWDSFETLHARQNEVFERCITDRTRGLIS